MAALELSLAAEGRGYSLVAVCGLHIAAASLEEHELQGAWASLFQQVGSAVETLQGGLQELWCIGVVAQ